MPSPNIHQLFPRHNTKGVKVREAHAIFYFCQTMTLCRVEVYSSKIETPRINTIFSSPTPHPPLGLSWRYDRKIYEEQEKKTQQLTPYSPSPTTPPPFLLNRSETVAWTKTALPPPPTSCSRRDLSMSLPS